MFQFSQLFNGRIVAVPTIFYIFLENKVTKNLLGNRRRKEHFLCAYAESPVLSTHWSKSLQLFGALFIY